MDISTLLRALRTFRLVAIVGVAVAVVAAVLAGFGFTNGRLELRSQSVYNSATNLLLQQPRVSEFQSELPSVELAEGQTTPVQRDLASLAVIYAYFASGDAVQAAAEGKVGALQPGESISAAQRTTQPAGNERNPGRYQLPIVQISATAATSQRADDIAGAASEAFVEFAQGRQATEGVPADERIGFAVLEAPRATLSDDSSNPYIPIVAAGAGVLFAFLALILVLYNLRLRREADGVEEVSEQTEGTTTVSRPAVA